MRKAIVLGILMSVMLMSCTKTNTTTAGGPLNHNGDNTSAWIGTYTGSASGNTVNRVITSKVNDSVVQMQLQVNVSGTYYTYATISHAALTTTTNATIDEDGLIATYSDTYHFSGSALVNGNNLTISGSATSTTHPSDVKPYYFYGSK